MQFSYRFSWKSSHRHLVLKMLSLPNMTCISLKCTCSLISSIQPGLPPPMLTYFNTALHHFCLLPNTGIECWCPNVQSDPQTMLKVVFHQAGVVCQTSTNMSGYCSVKSTALIFDSLSLVLTLSIPSIAQPTAS